MSTILAYGIIGENVLFSDSSAEVIETENRRVMIDALIFNRDELVSSDADESFSDAFLLFSLIEREGWEVLKRVNGDFAGAVYEKKTGIWTLFRDHLGVRPIYYYSDGSLFATATDIRDIAYVPGVHLKIDEKQLWLNLAGYNGQDLRSTDFDNIRCVCPGSVTVFTPSGKGYEIKETRYFKPGMKKIRMNSDDEYIAELRRLVEDSIRRRVAVVDGNAGAELSGGLDSSVIDILVNRMGKPLKCVSWRIVPDDWPLQPVDERIVIRDVCRQENLECEFIPAAEAKNEFDRLLPPFDNTPDLGITAKIMNGKEIKYVFSGQGGDEGVSHRAKVFELLRAREFSYYLREIWTLDKGKSFRLLSFFCRLIKYAVIDYPRATKPWHSELNALSLLTEDYKRRMKGVKGYPLYFSIDPVLEFEYGGLRLRPETAAYQAEEFKVQYLYPFEDYRVFDFAVSIPRHLYLKDGINRWIYRQAFKDIMPKSLRDVDYKDFPSLRNGKPKIICATESKTTLKEQLLNELDRERWSFCIDFNALNNLPEPENVENEEEQSILLFALFSLYRLIQIQRMICING